MTHTHNTDHMFRDAAKRYHEKPPDNAWAVIDSAINKGKRRKAFVLTASTAAVIILLLGFGAGYLYRSVSEETPEVVNLMQENAVNKPVENQESAPLLNLDTEENTVEVAGNTNSNSVNSEKEHSNVSRVSENEMFTNNVIEKPSSNSEFKTIASHVEPIEQEIAASNTNVEIVDEDQVLTEQLSSDEQAKVSEEPVMTQQEKNIQLEQMMTNLPDNAVSSIPHTSGETYYYGDMPIKPELYDSKWSVGGDVAAAYAFRNMPSEEMEYKERSPIADEQGVSSWNAGVYATNEIAGAIRVKTGITWASYGQGSQNLYAYQEGPSFSVNSSSGSVSTNIYADQESLKPLSNNSLISDPDAIMLDETELFAGKGLSDPNLMLVQRFDYLEIPFMVQLSTNRGEGFSFVTEAGLYAGILTGNRAFLKNSDERYLVGYTENLRPLSLGAVAGAGAKYAFSESFSAEIIPEFRYSFFSISNIPEIEYHPYQLGLGLGLTYHF